MSTSTSTSTTRMSLFRIQFEVRFSFYILMNVSGTNAECVTNNIDEAWAPLAQWLRCNGRQAFNTETGGGNTASCQQFLCEQTKFQAQNSDGKSSFIIRVSVRANVIFHSILGIRRLVCG